VWQTDDKQASEVCKISRVIWVSKVSRVIRFIRVRSVTDDSRRVGRFSTELVGSPRSEGLIGSAGRVSHVQKVGWKGLNKTVW
jgi:hypothetical protein